MPHDPDKYRQLLGSVRSACAEYDQRLFCLEAITKEEMALIYADPKLLEATNFLAFIPLSPSDEDGEDCQGFYIALKEPICPDGGVYRREHYDVFVSLAKEAGAWLPRRLKEQIKQRAKTEPATMLAWWLSCMWWTNPPSDESLAESTLLWGQPFLQFAETIEQCQLTATNPALPNSSDEKGSQSEHSQEDIEAAPTAVERDLTGTLKPEKPKTTNQLMSEIIQEKPEAMGWTTSQWASKLKRARSTVHATSWWKTLESHRIRARAGRANDRRRKSKENDQWGN